MRALLIPLVASIAFAAAPAFAQSAANNAGNPAPGMQMSMETQQKLRQSLEQSGFKDISIVPEAYLIRAQAPDGSRIAMEVTPDQAEGFVTPPHAATAPTHPGPAGTSH